MNIISLALAPLINGRTLLHAVIWLIVAGVIFGLLYWLVDFCKIPEPFSRGVKVILAIIAVLLVINALLTLVGAPIVGWP